MCSNVSLCTIERLSEETADLALAHMCDWSAWPWQIGQRWNWQQLQGSHIKTAKRDHLFLHEAGWIP